MATRATAATEQTEAALIEQLEREEAEIARSKAAQQRCERRRDTLAASLARLRPLWLLAATANGSPTGGAAADEAMSEAGAQVQARHARAAGLLLALRGGGGGSGDGDGGGGGGAACAQTSHPARVTPLSEDQVKALPSNTLLGPVVPMYVAPFTNRASQQLSVSKAVALKS